jgi:hypothetical protein
MWTLLSEMQTNKHAGGWIQIGFWMVVTVLMLVLPSEREKEDAGKKRWAFCDIVRARPYSLGQASKL